MVSCTAEIDNPPCTNCPEHCYLDVLNIAYANNQRNGTDPIIMPWVDQRLMIALTYSYFPPQRVLFDLPFMYYIKLVFYIMSTVTLHHLQ